MTIHLCRDFPTLVSASCPGTNMYALAMFLHVVGGFGVIGQTSFNMLSSSITRGQGNNGSINSGVGTYEVVIPSASYVVSSADVNRILALRSPSFPLANSGLFRITSVDVANNGLVVDYRSSASPPNEQDLIWTVFEKETVFSGSWLTGSNGTPNYGSYDTGTAVSNASRIILQSPDPSSWQVRMCLESAHDVNGAVPSGFSIAPGYGGNANGDFGSLVDGPGVGKLLHLHAAQWYNTTSSVYRGMTVGLSPCYNTFGQWRISMVVDDVSGTCGIVNQNVSLPAPVHSGSGWCVFGLTVDETEPPSITNLGDATLNIQRLFVAGSSNSQSNLTWTSQFHSDNNMQVVGWSKLGYPVAGVMSLYSDISNPSSHIRYVTSSVSTPWINATELLDAEVLLGTVDVTLSSTTTGSLWPFQPRRVGRLPIFMQGRANYPSWTLSSDGGWYHTLDGVFMPWGGPAPSGSLGDSAYGTSGSIELQQGLDPLGAYLPGIDPPVAPTAPNVSDIDATRYRKTYSYFRQVPVNATAIPGGSNPAKP